MKIAFNLRCFAGLLFLSCVFAVPAVGETIRCVPLYPVFCGNIHIGCAWRSRVPSRAFSVLASEKDVHVAFDDGDNWKTQAPKENGERVITDPRSRNWIRIDSKDRFSMRIYRKGKALMALGSCKRGGKALP